MKEDRKFNYRILKEHNLVIKYYAGKLSVDDIYGFTKMIGDDPDYLPTMSVINDFRDCYFTIVDEAILEFISKVKETPQVYAPRKSVFLTHTPNQVVFSSMIEMFKDETFIDLKIVSTITGALHHLMIPSIDHSLIQSIIDELKQDRSGSL